MPSKITPGHHRTTSDPTADSTFDAAHPQPSRLPSRDLVPPAGTPGHHCLEQERPTTTASSRRPRPPPDVQQALPLETVIEVSYIDTSIQRATEEEFLNRDVVVLAAMFGSILANLDDTE